MIIPIFNEGSIINKAIDDIISISKGRDIEIIVSDGSSKKATLNAVKERKIIIIHSKKGRGTQMNAGVKLASKECLIFLHADTRLPKNALDKIEDCFTRKVFVGAFKLGIYSENFLLKVIEFFANLRTSFTKVPYGDQAIFIKRDVFLKLGGYANIQLMEDISFMKKVKKTGRKIEIIKDRVSTSDRKWKKEGILRGTFKNLLLRGCYHLGINPEKLYQLYYSKK